MCEKYSIISGPTKAFVTPSNKLWGSTFHHNLLVIFVADNLQIIIIWSSYLVFRSYFVTDWEADRGGLEAKVHLDQSSGILPQDSDQDSQDSDQDSQDPDQDSQDSDQDSQDPDQDYDQDSHDSDQDSQDSNQDPQDSGQSYNPEQKETFPLF